MSFQWLSNKMAQVLGRANVLVITARTKGKFVLIRFVSSVVILTFFKVALLFEWDDSDRLATGKIKQSEKVCVFSEICLTLKKTKKAKVAPVSAADKAKIKKLQGQYRMIHSQLHLILHRRQHRRRVEKHATIKWLRRNWHKI